MRAWSSGRGWGASVDEADPSGTAGGRQGHAGQGPDRGLRHSAALDRRHPALGDRGARRRWALRPRKSWIAATWSRTRSSTASSPSAWTRTTASPASSSTASRAPSPQAEALGAMLAEKGMQARRGGRDHRRRRTCWSQRIVNRAKETPAPAPRRRQRRSRAQPARRLSRADRAAGRLLPRQGAAEDSRRHGAGRERSRRRSATAARIA